MSVDEYQLILWLLGSQPMEFNQTAIVMLVAWFSLSLTRHIFRRLYNHLEYRLDVDFWHDVMPEEQLSL